VYVHKLYYIFIYTSIQEFRYHKTGECSLSEWKKVCLLLECQNTSQWLPGNQKIEGLVYLVKGKFVSDEIIQLYRLKIIEGYNYLHTKTHRIIWVFASSDDHYPFHAFCGKIRQLTFAFKTSKHWSFDSATIKELHWVDGKQFWWSMNSQ